MSPCRRCAIDVFVRLAMRGGDDDVRRHPVSIAVSMDEPRTYPTPRALGSPEPRACWSSTVSITSQRTPLWTLVTDAASYRPTVTPIIRKTGAFFAPTALIHSATMSTMTTITVVVAMEP